ncbi:MAG: PLP-dependent aminotransferase family protein [Lachnospiraceae bacterium]|nr:PLP-dependent aminotransferase family protein [Lachnospiraceae bacterium]
MKQILLETDNSSSDFLYEQLYLNIKNQILSGDMLAGEKCPSVRSLSANLSVSVTTVMQAYNQLLAEGYISSKPGSGYYVERVIAHNTSYGNTSSTYNADEQLSAEVAPYINDNEIFDFNKWKKCSNRIFTEYSDSLLFESDIKGEYSLRLEISKYLRQSRGVNAKPENIIISAGTQQIAFHLGRILKKDQVNIIALESPGYSPVKSMFTDAAFNTIDIPVTKAGIDIDILPSNLKSAVYVNPSNQFPTGVVMPAGKRYEILNWAYKNNCYVIEDDYNSELRYFGQPLPPIKSLDTNDRVIYLGSFSSTLFSAIKISYMVLTDNLTKVFDNMKENYTQTCSKAEQLTLALFMKEGYYYTAIKKKRTLYTKKLQESINAFSKYGKDKIKLTNTKSGLTLTLMVDTNKTPDELIQSAKEIGIRAYYINELSSKNKAAISLYYSNIPAKEINQKIKELCTLWK